METKTLKFKPAGNIERSYRQKEFVISTFQINGIEREEVPFEDAKRIITNLKEAHHNQIELGWAHHNTIAKAIKVCNELGLKLIIQDLSRFGGFQESIQTDEELERIVKEVSEEYKGEKCLGGFYIWDEPCRDDAVALAAKYTDYFYKYAPGLLNLAILIPSYNSLFTWNNGKFPDYVKHFLDTIKPPVVSFDYYPFGVGPVRDDTDEQLDISNMWKDLAVMRKECLERDIPFWFYFETIRLNRYPKELTNPMITSNIFYALLYGAKGLQSFGATGSNASVDKELEKRRFLEMNGEKGYFYDALKEALGTVKAWGNTLMALTSEHIYHDENLLKGDAYFDEHFREDIKNSSVFDMEKLEKRCSLGEFRDSYGNKYILVLNRDYKEEKEFKITFRNTSRVYEVSKRDGMQGVVSENTKELVIKLLPGDAALYRIDDASKPEYSIKYECGE